jgi:uncharacterized membrane protein HdeD (DUF308 family)
MRIEPNPSQLFAGPHLQALAERWWVPVVRGIAAVVFGILALVAPTISLFALVIMWGAYAFVDGAFNLVHAARKPESTRSWWWLVVEGLISLGAGIFTFVYPGITTLALVTIIAVWAVLTGIAEIAAAIRLRREVSGEWLLAASGVLSIVLGLFLFLSPGAGALALVWVIGVYAIIFGLMLIALGVRFHNWFRRTQRPLGPPLPV